VVRLAAAGAAAWLCASGWLRWRRGLRRRRLAQAHSALLGPARARAAADASAPVHQIRRDFFRRWCRRWGLDSARWVHVAGTNGKGSVCSCIHAGLCESGVAAGLFTSPHVHVFRERIQVGRERITETDFLEVWDACAPALASEAWMVPFDRYLAVALVHFARRGVQVVVLETGIGGRFDSTNFVSQPEVCVLTRISHDHVGMLGNRLEDIAWQKAGIMKPRCPVLTTTTQLPEVLRTLEAEAQLVGCPLTLVESQGPAPGATCRQQQENAALASAALRVLGYPGASMQDAPRFCRFERFTFHGPHRSVVLDGAHNPEGLALLLAEVRRLRDPPRRRGSTKEPRLAAIFGVAQDKDVPAMVSELVNNVHVVYPVQAPGRTALPATEVAALATKHGAGAVRVDVEARGNPIRAFTTALASLPVDGTLVVCGSFYICAAIREEIAKVMPRAFSKDDPVHERACWW